MSVILIVMIVVIAVVIGALCGFLILQGSESDSAPTAKNPEKSPVKASAPRPSSNPPQKKTGLHQNDSLMSAETPTGKPSPPKKGLHQPDSLMSAEVSTTKFRKS
ncbi:MAG: hypothetical protein V3G42_08615 [Oscillospiraceae bacterium]